MNKQVLKDTLGWGFLLWLFGYVLGFLFFALVPANMIGYVITPIGVAVTLRVLFKQINSNTLSYYLKLSIAWTLMAIICDYFFLVQVLHPADGYYKFDVYLYYAITFALPLIVGYLRKKSS